MPSERLFVGIILFIVAAIVPILVRLNMVYVPEEFLFMHPHGLAMDVFSYYKAWLLVACAGILWFNGASEWIVGGKPISEIVQTLKNLCKDPIVILLAVYMFFVLISNIFSHYTHTALFGVTDRREGLFVQIAYITVFFAARMYVKGSFNANMILKGFLFSSLIMGIIGFSQFIGHDLYDTPLLRYLLTGDREHAFAIRFDFAFGTSPNPNTFGIITAIMFPVLLAAGFANPRRGWQAAFLSVGVLIMINVIASRSVGGFIGASTAIAATATTLVVRWIYQRRVHAIESRTENETKSGAKKRPISLWAALAVAVILFGVSLGAVVGHNDLTFTLGRIADIFNPPEQPRFAFNNNTFTVEERGVVYHITFPLDSGQPIVETVDRLHIEPRISNDAGGVVIDPIFVYDIPGHGYIQIQIQNAIYSYRGIFFTIENNRLYMTNRTGTVLIDPEVPVPSWGFEGWESWGSGRGHIFSRSLPLLPRYWLVGSGSDTFSLTFPQNDPIGKLIGHGIPNIHVTMAHNMYLQTAITTGLVSALALIGLFGYYIITTFISLVKDKGEDVFAFRLRVGLLASVSAFSVSSLSTDSTVSSTPMFWLIIGMGFAINRWYTT